MERIKLIINFRDDGKTIVDEILEADGLNEIAKILRPFHDKSVYINIIYALCKTIKKQQNENCEGEIEILC